MRDWLRLVWFCFALSGTGMVAAQSSRTLHVSCSADSARVITLRLQGDVTVVPWNGNLVMVETLVTISNANKGVFDFIVDKTKRYDVGCTIERGANLLVRSKVIEREPLKTTTGLSEESVSVRVFIPRRFRGEGLGPFGRIASSKTVPAVRDFEALKREMVRPVPVDTAADTPARDSSSLRIDSLSVFDTLGDPDEPYDPDESYEI